MALKKCIIHITLSRFGEARDFNMALQKNIKKSKLQDIDFLIRRKVEKQKSKRIKRERKEKLNR